MRGRDRIRAPRALTAGVLAACLALGAAPSAQAGPLRTRLLALINHVREDHGLRALRLNVRLSEDAQRHTRRMIRRGEVYDPPNLEQLLEPYRWDTAGAATGCDRSLRAIVRGWLGSSVHRGILLHPGLRRAGIGVIRVDGRSACGRDRVWATAILYG